MARRTSTEHEYVERINRVIDYVQVHFAEPLALETLARVAKFSPFHFHRVFRACTGETVRAHLERVRVEHAAVLLSGAGSRQKLVDVALACGFATLPELSRAFGERFGVPPGEFRKQSQASKTAQEAERAQARLPAHARSRDDTRPPVRVVRRPACHLLYVRTVDPLSRDHMQEAKRTLDAFAKDRGLEDCERLGLTIDDPELTPAASCRYDLALVTDVRKSGGDGVSTRALPAGEFVEIHARGTARDVGDAWEALFAWLVRSDYEPAAAPAMERYRAEPDFVRWNGFDVVLSLPVERARRAR